MIQEFKAGNLNVRVYESRQEMGAAAAQEAAAVLKALLAQKEGINVIFAAAPSQNEFLQALQQHREVDWNRINAFHMDEYISLPEDAPQGFGNFLKTRIFDALRFRTVNYLNGNAGSAECDRYTALLNKYPPDIVFMGIGENGHLAFNDPPVADFKDPLKVKVVALDEACRRQQVNDGCFTEIGEVPTHALTLTIPTLMQAPYIYCIVPGSRKSEAVRNTITQPIQSKYPSTILREHPRAILYLDRESGMMAGNQNN